MGPPGVVQLAACVVIRRGSKKTFQQTVMTMKKSILCQVLTQKYSIKNKVYKGFKIHCSKAKFPVSWPKNSFHVFEISFSGRKKTRVSFSKESRKIRNGYNGSGYIEFKIMFPVSSQIMSLDT